ncbi:MULTISPECIES: peroxiredoxin [Aeromonas]|jgi:peroxiredoxin|uniref:Glutathione-dependent peroxiredoxin n=1 Tax=Aeromonas hydrophila subsp. hydrophila (strain ATCC 7966 / DSM 30187 / BCRC 13018 / CCUG 14551 / JCM 1027 / KCTC 2358 / NCIMB 9240 / NCTC 8049) TaxID=380703 RepID=A0KHQ8_AERHH|nr:MULTISPECIES: peroxiredoxin [Aeromonas]ABK38817.1 peroxiredoxin [Aeromonas hydrophila subsp. hydrophila ATCC 7966]ANT67113.1 peroxiredoxin [Aeromonas hydrophila]MBS4670478.1 peroxiredoxin [Aeromonas hydrophila]MCP3243121.1 peroxiredoxin [Aeromonas hydrophila]MCR3908161.1 peroxiredoxin [Aeromonas hydrophila]
MIAIGQALPAGEFTFITAEGKQQRDSQSLFGGKRVVLFAVPGAFTPTCSNAHLPGYVVLADKFKEKGVDAICCLSVNDAFVMKAWQDAQNAEAITMLADGDGSWTRALGLAKETGAFGGVRAQRFALIANDGVVEQLFVEAPGKFEVSDAQSLLAAL